MTHPYFPQGDGEIQDMLAAIGVSSMDDLFASIPDEVKLTEPLSIPQGLSEKEVVSRVEALSRRNRPGNPERLFLGGGAYNHYIPAVVDALVSRTEFTTSYTPYQPEISQGHLAAIFEYQTMIASLTGSEVANASLYDGATSVVEALMMAHRLGRKKRTILLAASLNPQARQVVRTYLQNLDFLIREIPTTPEGWLDLQTLEALLSDDTLAVVVQSPNAFGVVEDLEAVSRTLAERRVIKIAVVQELLSLGILQPPGAFGFDIVCGEAQSAGIPLSFGGPHLGFIAAKKAHVRQMPGRIVGETKDVDGKRGFVLTLATREQHIRREKATSNICSNHALMALVAAITLELAGRMGWRQLAEVNLRRAHALRAMLDDIEGVTFPFSGPFFNEFALNLPDGVVEKLHEEGFLVGPPLGGDYPELKKAHLVAVTEMNGPGALRGLADAVRRLV